MLSSPRTPSSASGLKRRREAHDIAERRPKIGTLVPGEPSREAQVGWGGDFPINFKVLSKIGEGSFGTVWTAKRVKERDGGNARGEGGGVAGGNAEEEEEEEEGEGGGEETGGLVALKRINPTCSPSRILNEFEQMRKLAGRHNVIRVQGVLRTPGGAFALVMPFFEHDDFRQTMKTITLSGVAVYMRALLTALAYVHGEGIIHRDIKPRNFMYNSRKAKGFLIDFGLAEPAERWKCRSEALAAHRTRRALRTRSRGETPLSLSSRTGNPRGISSSSRSNHEARSMGVEGRVSVESAREKEERSKLLRKVERGGTTGFRSPEILWHCRDQEPAVDVWSAGVILLCLLSRRYPFFPSADSDEMALVQIAALLGSGEIVRAARKSGRCDIAEFPSQKAGSLERLCAPLLGGGASSGGGGCEGKARADALCLVRGMLKVDPKERLSAKDALMHPFVEQA